MPDWLIMLLLLSFAAALAWRNSIGATPGSAAPILPIEKDTEGLALELALRDAAKQPISQVGKGKKVLIISDAIEICWTMSAVLNLHAFQARYIGPRVDNTRSPSHIQKTADEILTNARDPAPDWVIICLGGQEDPMQIQVATAIHKQTPTVKFLFISWGASHNKDMENASGSGLDLRLLIAPFSPEAMVDVLSKPPYGGQWKRDANAHPAK